MRLRKRVWELEADAARAKIRFEQLECEHEPVAFEFIRPGLCGGHYSTVYRLKCSKCGKIIKESLTWQQYLESKRGAFLEAAAQLREKLEALNEDKEPDDA